MAEPDSTWREVRLGIAVVLLFAAGLAAFWIARAGNPFVEQYSLVFFVESAKGLQEGAAVRLSGLLVGEVARVEVLGAAPALRARYRDRLKDMHIRVVIDVDERYRQEITDRSQVRLGSEGASGVRYVRVEKGPVAGRPLSSGERIPVAPSLDVDLLLERGMEVLGRVAELNRNAELVAEKVKSGSGSLGRFLEDPDDNPLSENMELMNREARKVMRSIDEGHGTLPLERRTRRVRENVKAFQTSLERIESHIRAGEGTAGAFAKDTTLPNALERLQARAAAISGKLDRGEGSLGRLLHDPELFDQLHLLSLAVDSLVTTVAGDPLGSVDVDLH